MSWDTIKIQTSTSQQMSHSLAWSFHIPGPTTGKAWLSTVDSLTGGTIRQNRDWQQDRYLGCWSAVIIRFASAQRHKRNGSPLITVGMFIKHNFPLVFRSIHVHDNTVRPKHTATRCWMNAWQTRSEVHHTTWTVAPLKESPFLKA